MSKIYQPIVIEEAERIIDGLSESGFFKDYEIKNLTFAKKRIMDILTDKFINGTLFDEENDLFTDLEFDQLLKGLISGSILYDLKEKGLVDSYEDENTEEVFFLTEEGKKHMDNLDNIV
jgi:predicted transcriptional regulator